MKILAIESSGMPASAALLEDEKLLAEYTISYQKTHSQTLMPLIDEMTSMVGLDLKSLDAVAVSGGPGSFTGLRIGSATAKGIGLALELPLISVPTLEGMAYNYCGSRRILCPMLDARNKQVFAGIYTFSGDMVEVLMDQTAMDSAKLCLELNKIAGERGESVLLYGDGADACRDIFEERLTCPHDYAPAHLKAQRASSLAVRAGQLFRGGKIQTAAEHRPDYLRVSQAERVRAQKQEG